MNKRQPAKATRIESRKQNDPPVHCATYDRVSRRVACPRCRLPRTRVRNVLQAQDGTRVRYHVCPQCGSRVKSVEEV